MIAECSTSNPENNFVFSLFFLTRIAFTSLIASSRGSHGGPRRVVGAWAEVLGTGTLKELRASLDCDLAAACVHCPETNRKECDCK